MPVKSHRSLGLYHSLTCGGVLCASFAVYAQTPVNTPQNTHQFESNRLLTAPLPAPAPIPADAPVVQETFVLPSIMRSDAVTVLAQQIDQAIRHQQWQHLSDALSAYAAHPQADPSLILYAQGALYRQQKDYSAAIAAYTALLAAHPDLPYVHLDLALMLAEDKQFAHAIQTLDDVVQAPQTPAPVRTAAQAYLGQLRKVYTLDPRVNATFTRNDNVNQASAERIVYLGQVPFVKDKDSLPKVGHGVNYGLQLRRPFAIQGHHGVLLDARYNGVYYWDQGDYSEHTLRFAPSYTYQSYHHNFKLGPVLEKNWLGGKPYVTRQGAQVEWAHTLSVQHSVIPYVEFARKRYASPNLDRYEGKEYRAGVTLLYQPQADRAFWLGLNNQRDVLKDVSESSTQQSVRLGGLYPIGKFTVQANAQIGRRHFDTWHSILGLVRRDQEHAFSISLWHSELRILGITPKLVYNWRNIHSNISALYSRRSQGLMMEIVEMAF